MACIIKDKFRPSDDPKVGCSGSEVIDVPKGVSALSVARHEAKTSAYGRVVIQYDNGRTRVYDRFSTSTNTLY